MAYDVTLVQYNSFGPGGLSGTGTFGFPTTNFNYVVASMWVCLPFVGGNGCDIGMSNVFDVLASSRARGGLPDNKITLNLTTTNNLGQNISMYSATFGGLTTNVRANILLSVDAQNQIVQLYVNDVPQIATSGGWVASGQFPGELSFLQSYASDFGSDGGTPLVEPAVADMYTACPGTFFDLSIEGNRRKFINTDLTPVYLGPSGALPGLGIPPVYLTVPSGGVATDFLHNYGLGPSFGLSGNITSVSFQTPGTCHLPSIVQIPLTGVSATGQVGAFFQFRQLELVSLYPILPSSGDVYGLISDFGADFPANFSQFSLSVWCCEDVNIRGPDSYGTPFSFDMKFTPATATLQFYDSLNQVLFSGSFANPHTPTNLYHVMFSINTQAQTYALWIASGAAAIEWTTSDANFATIGGINNVGA